MTSCNCMTPHKRGFRELKWVVIYYPCSMLSYLLLSSRTYWSFTHCLVADISHYNDFWVRLCIGFQRVARAIVKVILTHMWCCFLYYFFSTNMYLKCPYQSQWSNDGMQASRLTWMIWIVTSCYGFHCLTMHQQWFTHWQFMRTPKWDGHTDHVHCSTHVINLVQRYVTFLYLKTTSWLF